VSITTWVDSLTNTPLPDASSTTKFFRVTPLTPATCTPSRVATPLNDRIVAFAGSLQLPAPVMVTLSTLSIRGPLSGYLAAGSVIVSPGLALNRIVFSWESVICAEVATVPGTAASPPSPPLPPQPASRAEASSAGVIHR
jgi:hypothetical protein